MIEIENYSQYIDANWCLLWFFYCFNIASCVLLSVIGIWLKRNSFSRNPKNFTIIKIIYISLTNCSIHLIVPGNKWLSNSLIGHLCRVNCRQQLSKTMRGIFYFSHLSNCIDKGIILHNCIMLTKDFLGTRYIKKYEAIYDVLFSMKEFDIVWSYFIVDCDLFV